MNRGLVALVISAAALPMLIGVAQLPRPGDPAAPVQAHVAARYIESGAAEAGAANLVTGVLLNYRSFDTFGEVMVIFSALAAVMAVLAGAGRAPPGQPQAPVQELLPISPVVAFVIRIAAPFIALFGVFVILMGHVSPGGGFQGGVILGALLILLSVGLERGTSAPLVPVAAARWLQATAPLAFAVTAALGLALTGAVLGFPADPSRSVLRELMMIGLEIGIGVGGAVVILGLFLAMRGE